MASPFPESSPTAPGVQFTLNLEALQVVRETWDLPSGHWVRVDSPVGSRQVHVIAGNLVGGASTIPEDRLGILLAEEGRYDVDLLEPMAREAQTCRVRFGELLVADGLLSAAELQRALERQVVLRLRRLLTMPGLVTAGEGAQPDVSGRPLGALVLDFFRSSVAVASFGSLLADLEQRRLHFTMAADRLPRLGLSEEELLLIVRNPVLQGRVPLETAAVEEPVLRLIAGLIGVGVLTRGKE